MKRSKFTDEQILKIVREGEAGRLKQIAAEQTLDIQALKAGGSQTKL